MINVAVCGANGKMGQEVIKAVEDDNDMSLVAKIAIYFTSSFFSASFAAFAFIEQSKHSFL